MSTTYTVTEHHDGFAVFRDGNPVSWWGRKAIAQEQAHSLNVHEHAFAMLALLVESRDLYWDSTATDDIEAVEQWEKKRDALIAQITGEPKL